MRTLLQTVTLVLALFAVQLGSGACQSCCVAMQQHTQGAVTAHRMSAGCASMPSPAPHSLPSAHKPSCCASISCIHAAPPTFVATAPLADTPTLLPQHTDVALWLYPRLARGPSHTVSQETPPPPPDDRRLLPLRL